MATTQIRLTEDQLAALRSYSNTFGRTWKSKLNTAWFNGTDVYEANERGESIGYLLRQVRNQFGPSWLVKFSFAKPATHSSQD
jgi:hypothetical protein